MTTNYGAKSYWDKRYGIDFPEPFDWLCDYEHLQQPIRQLLPQHAKILVPGCGNAVFSADMYNDGFKGIVNVDISPVVVAQQQERYPHMIWREMDCLNMPTEDGEYQGVVDKSLIDTILCSKNSQQNLDTMIHEMYRSLAPGGVYLTLSLHAQSDIIDYFMKENLKWVISTFSIRNPRWNLKKGVKRSIAHTLVICQKTEGIENDISPIRNLAGTLSAYEAAALREQAAEASSERLFRLATAGDLLSCLDNSLAVFMESFPDQEERE